MILMFMIWAIILMLMMIMVMMASLTNYSKAVRIPKITILVSHKTTEYTIKVGNDDDTADDDDDED